MVSYLVALDPIFSFGRLACKNKNNNNKQQQQQTQTKPNQNKKQPTNQNPKQNKNKKDESPTLLHELLDCLLYSIISRRPAYLLGGIQIQDGLQGEAESDGKQFTGALRRSERLAVIAQ